MGGAIVAGATAGYDGRAWLEVAIGRCDWGVRLDGVIGKCKWGVRLGGAI